MRPASKLAWWIGVGCPCNGITIRRLVSRLDTTDRIKHHSGTSWHRASHTVDAQRTGAEAPCFAWQATGQVGWAGYALLIVAVRRPCKCHRSRVRVPKENLLISRML